MLMCPLGRLPICNEPHWVTCKKSFMLSSYSAVDLYLLLLLSKTDVRKKILSLILIFFFLADFFLSVASENNLPDSSVSFFTSL